MKVIDTRREQEAMWESPARKDVLKISDFTIRPGTFLVNGTFPTANSVTFTTSTLEGKNCELVLFRKNEEEPYAIIPFPPSCRIGDTYSMTVYGLNIEEFEYCYRIDGPYDPDKGLLFDKNNYLLDPYAHAVAGHHVWGHPQNRPYRARVAANRFNWGNAVQSKKELSDLIIYELHIRNFTMDPSSGVEYPGTFKGLQEKIPYLKKLGVNAVELMPIFEFDENMNARDFEGRRLIECWGYNTVSFFSPNNNYASNPQGNKAGMELKNLIKELHENDIDVILDVVFNHTAEGNENGRTISFKGYDNKVYYMLTPEGNYFNFSGCGNTLNCNHPVVRQMILECLRYWVVTYRVDGFRFDLASILGRGKDGAPMENPPLLDALANDPVLRNIKLIAEAWDAGGLYQVGSFPAHKRWAEWNGRYRDSIRSYLKGEFWESRTAARSIAGSGDLYGAYPGEENGVYNGYNSCVNFLTCHDGFTLYDLYAYNEKHNWCNGWNNTDGANDNRSWNCGWEGESNDPAVNELRFRMIRNACATLMCSRGTPMFLAGDEFGNTQYGNNNCYCQDNEMSWIDWNLLEKNQSLFEFFRYMIAFRKKHPVIRKRLPRTVCGMEPINSHGENAEDLHAEENARYIGLSFAGYDRKKGRDDMVFIAVNAYWEDVKITLPRIPRQGYWYLYVNTYGDGQGRYTYEDQEAVRIERDFTMRPRSVAVFAMRLH